MQRIGDDFILIFTICVSVFGLFTVLVFALKPPLGNENFLWQKPLVGIVFSLICVCGIVAAFLPKQCSAQFHFRRGKNNLEPLAGPIFLKAHHPSCEKFAAHVIHIGNYILCAACTGLLIGAVIALIGTTLYLFGGWIFEIPSSSVVLIGVSGVVLGFLQLGFKGFVRLVLNAFFVIGAFLVLAGIDELAQNPYVDLFLIVLIVFWLSTRILLSQWDHLRICSGCNTICDSEINKK